MAGTIACNHRRRAARWFSLTLLIPFLNTLFDQPAIRGCRTAFSATCCDAIVGMLLDPGDKMGSLRNVIILIVIARGPEEPVRVDRRAVRRELQEYVTRDLRNAVYAHLAHLPLGYFARTKDGPDPLARHQRHARDAAHSPRS